MKHYPPEFKTEAVALCRSRPGATVRTVVQDLGINHETLRNWIRIDDGHRADSPTATPAAGSQVGPTGEENAVLRRRVREFVRRRRGAPLRQPGHGLPVQGRADPAAGRVPAADHR